VLTVVHTRVFFYSLVESAVFVCLIFACLYVHVCAPMCVCVRVRDAELCITTVHRCILITVRNA
jgi:hypothetical protein